MELCLSCSARLVRWGSRLIRSSKILKQLFFMYKVEDIKDIETNIRNIKIVEKKKAVKFRKEFELDWNKNEEVFKAKNEPDIKASDIVKECKIGQGA